MNGVQKRIICWSIAATTIFLLIKICLLIPPIQSPDEHSHLYRAYMLSSGQLLLTQRPGTKTNSVFEKESQVGGQINQSLISFKDLHWPLVLDPHRQLTKSEMEIIDSLEWSQVDDFIEIPGAAYYFPAIYAPQALALALGRSINLGLTNSYYLARGFSACASLLLLYFSFRLVRPPVLAVLILCLPMAIFQTLSPTIDGLANGLTVLVLSIFLHLNLKKNISTAWLKALLALGIFLLVTTRIHAIPLLLLPYYLSWKYKSRGALLTGITISICSVLWIAFAIYTGHDARVPDKSPTIQLLLSYLSSPAELASMIWSSITSPQLFLFYSTSYVGLLGWLNVALPEAAYPLLWGGLISTIFMCFLPNKQEPALFKSFNLLLVAIAISSFLLVFLAMLVTWTTTNSPVIQGVQGRYFFIPTLIFSYSLPCLVLKPNIIKIDYTYAITLFVITTSIWSLIVALSARYS